MLSDSVAVVEAIITNCEQLASGPPAVTAIMPSEKTYNTASIRNSSTNLGGGIATQLVGVSGSFLFGHNSYFLVEDQDTIAQVFHPDAKDLEQYCGSNSCVGVRWIFRPVLGQRFLAPGRRKILVQLAFPVTDTAEQYGQVTIRRDWRHFDRKKGLIGDALDDRSAVLYSYERQRPVFDVV